MDRHAALDDVRTRFKYRTDQSKYGRNEYWRIMRNDTGPLEGDCEDFSLSVLWRIADKSVLKMFWLVLTFQAMIWHGTAANGSGHAALWYKGQWVDNIYPDWSDTNKHKMWLPYVAPLMGIKMLMGKL